MNFVLQSITFESFVIQAGSDFTGVATDMVSMNSTVKFTFRNTASFFGLHVASTPFDLSFSQISVGSGTVSPLILDLTNYLTFVKLRTILIISCIKTQ